MDHSPLTAYVEFEIRKENTTAEQWVARWAERALDAWQTWGTTLYETYPPPSTIEGNYINQFVRRNDVIIPARSGQARR